MNKIDRVCVRARVSVFVRKSVCLREKANEREITCNENMLKTGHNAGCSVQILFEDKYGLLVS